MDLKSRLGNRVCYNSNVYLDKCDPDRVIKIINKDSLEIEIYKQCQHESLGKCYDIFTDESMVLLYLQRYKNNIFDIHVDVRKLLLSIASALKVLHENGYIHLDIQPGNILKTGDGGLVLVDFDISEKIGGKRESFDIKKVRYSAPELGTDNYTEKSDIWSLGLVALDAHLYPSCRYTMKRMTQDDIEQKLNRLNDSNIQKLLRSMLNSDPEQRPSADQILSYLAIEQ